MRESSLPDRCLVLWSGLLLLILSRPAAAHNGALAIAVPVAGITIDGDFSDWPAGMTRYPIALPRYGVRPRGERDFQGSYRIGYRAPENALYLAVEMQDESAMIDTLNPTSEYTQDGCRVWLDARHEREKELPVGRYSVLGDTPGAFGADVKLADFEVAVHREPQVQRYEWRIDIQKKTQGQVQLRPGMSLGLDLVLSDKDTDGSFSWVAWGPGGNKFTSPGLGDVLLTSGPVGEPEGIRGQVRWEGSREGVAHARVQIQTDGMWLQVIADGKGIFEVGVPAGRYRMQLNWPGSGDHEQKVMEVRPGSAAQVEFIAPAPRGVRVPAGPGKGHWQTYSVADGLVSNTVYDILQDREGSLWFATENGVSRYDGRQFTSFTKRDGLALNWVTTVLEDREGNLWFGTLNGGVSRYDGTSLKTFTMQDGLASNYVPAIIEDRQGNLWFGTSGGVSRYDGTSFKTLTAQDGLAGNYVPAIIEDHQGNLWFGTNAGVSRYDGQSFKAFTTQDGLAGNYVPAIIEDRQGNLWFGTSGGVSRYDGTSFKTLTAQDGLAANFVPAIIEDRQGNLWFGTDGGVSRYDGKGFVTFTTADGLANNMVGAILEDREGSLWFGTGSLGSGRGVSRYSGDQLRNFTTADGLAHSAGVSVLEDRNGYLWFVTASTYDSYADWAVSRQDERGLTRFATEDGLGLRDWGRAILEDRQGNLWFGSTRYDGKHFRSFTQIDGLKGEPEYLLEDRQGRIWAAFGVSGVSRYENGRFVEFAEIDSLQEKNTRCLLEDRQGNIWFGTWFGGAIRYSGRQATAFTTKDGLGDDGVWALFEDRAGQIWFGTWNGGVSRYDGKGFQTWTVKEGLAGNWVSAIIQDQDGRYLIGTWGGGLSLFDGLVFQSLTARDGLADNKVLNLYQDHKGDIWIATEGGFTRYRPLRTPPPIRLTKVIADRDYGPVGELRLSTSQDYLAFAFQGQSLKTRPGQLAYVYRLQGYDEDWKATREEQVAYEDLPQGDYTFEVKAVDRDLNYSEAPATVKVRVHLPYTQLALGGGLALALVGLAFASGTAIRRRHAFLREQQARLQAQEQLNQELEKELLTAHELQMGLMPKEAPQIPSLDLAGRCIPANHVGGDFYQYFRQEGKLFIALADVTGHAMEAAIPMVMFSGILENQMEQGGTPQDLFARLNRSLHRTLKNRTLVCCVLAELDLSTRALRLASAAFPYPYHFCAATGEVVELQMDGYPLGVRPDTVYRVIEAQLESGDRVIFCSDGIIEAANGAGAQFGYERTAEAIGRGCAEGLSAAALLERIVAEVREFTGGAPQGDDRTIVVLRALGAPPLVS